MNHIVSKINQNEISTLCGKKGFTSITFTFYLNIICIYVLNILNFFSYKCNGISTVIYIRIVWLNYK